MSRALDRRAALIAALGALPLAGCSHLPWLGANDKPKLPGVRKPVLLLEDDVKADPALAATPVTLPPARRNEDWPQAGGSVSHCLQHVSLADSIREAWRASIGTGSARRQRLTAAPVEAGGRVFAVDTRDEVSAFVAQSGQRAWRFQSKDAKRGERMTTGGLAYDQGRVYVTGNNGVVLAIDAATGAELWRHAVTAPIRTAPAVTGGRVLVITADNQLFALDSRTGEPGWRHAGAFEQAGILGGATPASLGGIVIAAYSSGEVFALELETGRALWSDTVLRPRRTLAAGTFNDIVGDPVIDRDRVFVAGVSGEMVALDLQRGDRIWSASVTSTQMPWVAGEQVYVLTDRNELVCMLRADGRVRWVSPLGYTRDPKDPNSERVRWSGPVLAGERLLLASDHGEVANVSPYDGRVLGKARLRGPVTVPPVVADGTVYLLTDGGELLAYR